MSASPSPAIDYAYHAPPAPGTTLEVAPGIHWLRMPLPFALDHINLWLLEEAHGWTQVDCGIADDTTRALWETHFAGTLGGRPILRIIATHCHPDHLGNAAWLSARFGCAVTMTHGEFMSAHAIIDERAAHSPGETCALFGAHGMSPEDVSDLASRGNHYRRLVPVAPATYRRMQGGDRISAGGKSWEIIPGFGHSSEHAAMHDAASNVLISGDMLLPKISTNVAVWPSDPDGDPLGRFLDSIDNFNPLPPETLVLPSHGLPFRGIVPRTKQLHAHHADRLAELEQAIAAEHAQVTAAQMIPVLFRRELDLQQRFFAMGETIAHLNYLWHRARLTRSISADGAVRFAA